MAIIKKNYRLLPIASDGGSLSTLTKSQEVTKLRDPYVLFDFPDTNDRYQIGYAIIYPGCKTGGHVHDDAHEVYHIIDGYGKMGIGEEEFDVEPGDTFIVPLHKSHFTINRGNAPIKLFWIVIRV